MTVPIKLPLRLLVRKPCPAPGEGVHPYIFHAACCAVEAGLSDQDAAWQIEELLTREPKHREIEDALASARGNRAPARPRWPQMDQAAIRQIAAQGPTLKELWAASPEPLQGDTNRAEDIIDVLFPGNPLLCVGFNEFRFHTKPREQFLGRLHHRQFMVPSPMLCVKGRTRAGTITEKSDRNTGRRRFLVIESDHGSLDQQAAVIGHLSGQAPLALISFSGNKSIHGWFFCDEQPEDKLRRFMEYAARLGADTKMWGLSQFTRVPDGRRIEVKPSTALADAGITGIEPGRQRPFYFNPGVVR
ncbi:hypothetical protein ACXR0O_25505 [Verrucomicrobiota bacterium sgz303538]